MTVWRRGCSSWSLDDWMMARLCLMTLICLDNISTYCSLWTMKVSKEELLFFARKSLSTDSFGTQIYIYIPKIAQDEKRKYWNRIEGRCEQAGPQPLLFENISTVQDSFRNYPMTCDLGQTQGKAPHHDWEKVTLVLQFTCPHSPLSEIWKIVCCEASYQDS